MKYLGNSVAFSRGDKGFFALTGDQLDMTFSTNLPAGEYCNVITGCPTDTGCEGESATVDGSGNVHVKINNADDPMFAIHVGMFTFCYEGVICCYRACYLLDV